MFQHQRDSKILVPLDGSKRAEQAIPVAARIAQYCGGSVVLLHAVAIPSKYGPYLYESLVSQSPIFLQQVLDLETAKSQQYLADVAHSGDLVDMKTETVTLNGEAAPIILDVARDQHIDLIVMCSHGHTGFRRWMMGSVAQKVALQSPVPVLVLRDGGPTPTHSFPDHQRPLRSLMALVPLDGSESAEAALVPATQLITASTAPAHGILQLTRVIPFPACEQNDAQRRTDLVAKEQAVCEAEWYLHEVADCLRSGNITHLRVGVVCSIAEGKDVAEALIRIAEHGEALESTGLLGSCDLLVMATHGLSGMQRLVMGSVTERVLQATKLPILIVRACRSHQVPYGHSLLQETPPL